MFEYKVLKVDILGSLFSKEDPDEKIQSTLNELGREGWELVSAVANNIFEGKTDTHTLYLKRKID